MRGFLLQPMLLKLTKYKSATQRMMKHEPTPETKLLQNIPDSQATILRLQPGIS